jgi:hypothetical protein
MVSVKLKKLCKRLKIKLTIKRGSKRIPKSESTLKKQVRKCLKRKSAFGMDVTPEEMKKFNYLYSKRKGGDKWKKRGFKALKYATIIGGLYAYKNRDRIKKHFSKFGKYRFGNDEEEPGFFKRKKMAWKKWAEENPKYARAVKIAGITAATAGALYGAHRGLRSERGQKIFGSGYANWSTKTGQNISAKTASAKESIKKTFTSGPKEKSAAEKQFDRQQEQLTEQNKRLTEQLADPAIPETEKTALRAAQRETENKIAQVQNDRIAKQEAEEEAEREKKKKRITTALKVVTTGDVSDIDNEGLKIVAGMAIQNKDKIFEIASSAISQGEEELEEAQANGDEEGMQNAQEKINDAQEAAERATEIQNELTQEQIDMDSLQKQVKELNKKPKENSEQIKKLKEEINNKSSNIKQLTDDLKEIQSVTEENVKLLGVASVKMPKNLPKGIQELDFGKRKKRKYSGKKPSKSLLKKLKGDYKKLKLIPY